MKILSLFDGISCARVALDRAGIPVETYYASEVDKYAIEISKKNYPNIEHIGDIKNVRYCMSSAPFTRDCKYLLSEIDLLIGGSPCQDLSIAKQGRKGLEGERSGLFWEYVRVLKAVKPKYFILENVASMPKEAKATITEALFGIEPVMINAVLVSAQNRKRLFWVGKLQEDGTYKQVEIPLPKDRNIMLKDILENGEADRLKSYCIDANYYKGSNWENYKNKGRRQLIKLGNLGSDFQAQRVYSIEGKSVALSAGGGGQGGKTGLYEVNGAARRTYPRQKIENQKREKRIEIRTDGKANAMTKSTEDIMVSTPTIRKLTPIECERLQGLKDNYTEGVSNTQRYKALGNAFNVDVITHILKHI